MSEVSSNQDGISLHRRLSSKITGIVFWGAVLTGIIVVAVFIKQSEADFKARQDYQTIQLLRVIEAVMDVPPVTDSITDKAGQLQKAVDAIRHDDELIGAEIRMGGEKVLIGSFPEDAVIKTITSNHIARAEFKEKMVVTAYFDAASSNIYGTRKNLIVFLGVISFAFGLTINRILHKMLTDPIDKMIETAAAYAKGDKSVRFDESKDDEFGFMSRFINMALNASETMHQQLEESVQEQRAAKERAEQTLDELQRTQDRLVQTEKLASLGQLTAGIAHEIKNPLNFINNFSDTSVELLSELGETIAPYLKNMDTSVRDEITELLEDLSTDLKTIEKHGKRADSIVKNMLMHSRSDGGGSTPTDINALISEASGLAYHGERANDRDFQIEIDTRLADNLKAVMVVPQDITRVLINLLSNAFYATKKRKNNAPGENYSPTIIISTESVEDGIEIRIRDNGSGISQANRKELFTPFFTTKPTGQGTGLGLSISHDIITKQNNGRIEVDSKEGEFSQFSIWLPVAHDDAATSLSKDTG